MTKPQITLPGTPPDPLSAQPTFRATFYQHLLQLVAALEDANDLATWMNDASVIVQGAANYRGDYSGSALYAIGESVSYSGGRYIKKTTASSGTIPTNTTHWLKLPDLAPADVQTFTSSGSWSKPTGVTFVKVELVGGGGGGANNTSSGNACGGAGGGYSSKVFLASELSSTVFFSIGAAGSGAVSQASGSGANGGTSSFDSLIAYGGQGGSLTQGGNSFSVTSVDRIGKTFAGFGGGATGNADNDGQGHALGGGGGKYSGGDSLYGGGGGGGAVGSVDFFKGTAHIGPGGDGGDANALSGVKADNGANYGGGGGGSCNDGGGGDGADGFCRVISW
jgi:hypothetical protein